MDKYLKVKDVKEILGCRKKSFPKIKIGKQYYIPEDAFKNWERTYLFKEYGV